MHMQKACTDEEYLDIFGQLDIVGHICTDINNSIEVIANKCHHNGWVLILLLHALPRRLNQTVVPVSENMPDGYKCSTYVKGQLWTMSGPLKYFKNLTYMLLKIYFTEVYFLKVLSICFK